MGLHCYLLCVVQANFSFFQRPEINEELLNNDEAVTGSPLLALKLPCMADAATIVWPYCVLLNERTVSILSINVSDTNVTLKSVSTIRLHHSAAHLVGQKLPEGCIFMAYSSIGMYTIFKGDTILAHASILNPILGCYFWNDLLAIIGPAEIRLYGKLTDLYSGNTEGKLECFATYSFATIIPTPIRSPINVQFHPSNESKELYVIIGNNLLLLDANQLRKFLMPKNFP